MSDLPSHSKIDPAELVLGLVYGAGTDAEPVERFLRRSLGAYRYQVRALRLSDTFPTILDQPSPSESPDATRLRQDMGDRIRCELDTPHALAHLAVYLIADARRTRPTPPSSRTAWLVRSLRRPEEVHELRRIYGPRFVLLAVHSPEAVRLRTASARRRRWSPVTAARFDVEAIADIRRDEEDASVPYGQAMRPTFSLADFFVDASSPQELERTVRRTVEFLFGEPFVPPTRIEQAMYVAHTAGLRSTEMGRQVGAAIIHPSGDVLSVGTNDVPSPRGGLYWSPDQPDPRDFALEPPLDSNTDWQRRVSRELLVRLAERAWLAPERIDRREEDGEPCFDVTDSRLDEFLDDVAGTRFRSLTEFGRAVHAEMDAITTAARRGIAIEGATLVCTTFPCHNCTRHIISAGIKRVHYLHPYAKSLARDLHGDAVALDPEDPRKVTDKVVMTQYLGVAPRVYPQYFNFEHIDRKNERGVATTIDDRTAVTPRPLRDKETFGFGGPALPSVYVSGLERDVAISFRDAVRAKDRLNLPTIGDS